MNSRIKAEGLLFTLFIGVVMASALWFARDWPIRASIGVYALGGIGVVLAIWQIVLDARRAEGPQQRSQFEMPTEMDLLQQVSQFVGDIVGW